MLQQTQVDRVVPKYLSFLHRFPDFASLASASSSEVLREWQGLGYNRRALSLHRAAKAVMEDHGGVLPVDKATLMKLPGIGDYSASAIRAFAYNQPDAFIETNIRAVFIHHFFTASEHVTDAQLLPVVEAAIDHDNPRRWYHALMDYGVMLKQRDNASRRSAHHRPQSRFHGSRRQARGEILRVLLDRGELPTDGLRAAIPAWDSRFEDALSTMLKEGVVTERAGKYGLD
jgi:A/G-specific adenine glycosylase